MPIDRLPEPETSLRTNSQEELPSFSGRLVSYINQLLRVLTNNLERLDNLLNRKLNKEEFNSVAYFTDKKTAGTSGGSFVEGDWFTRVLNTEVYNTIEGCQLNSNNTITLPRGTYVITGRAPAHRVDGHKTRLRDISNAITLIQGSTAFSDDQPHNTQSDSFLNGVITLTTQTQLQLQHRCQSTKATDGLGVSVNLGEPELYAEIKIHKVA